MTQRDEERSFQTLDDVKQWVETKYLGRCGIHAVGKKNSTNAVRLYVERETLQLKEVMKRIKADCSPYAVDLVIQEMPRAGSVTNDREDSGQR